MKKFIIAMIILANAGNAFAGSVENNKQILLLRLLLIGQIGKPTKELKSSIDKKAVVKEKEQKSLR